MTTPKIHVTFVRVENQLFPQSKIDVNVLRENYRFTPTRIQERTFDILLQTILKGLTYTIIEWDTAIQQILSNFKEAVRSRLPDCGVKFKTAPDHSSIMVLIPTDDADALLSMPSLKEGTSPNRNEDAPTDEHPDVATFLKLLAPLHKYMGQYSHKIVNHRSSDPEAGGELFTINFEYVGALANSMFYARNLEQPSDASILMGPSYRLRFMIDMLGEKPTLTVTSEDRLNGVWVPNHPRSFNLSMVDADSVTSVVNFLLSNF